MTACRTWKILCLVVLLSAGLVGCKAKGGSDSNAVAATADEAVELMARNLADGKPDALWNSLPDSYRADATELVHEMAGKVDVELWSRSFRVLSKASTLLRDKREFILAHPMVAGQIKDRDEAERNWDSVVDLFDVFVDSELSDLNKVRNLDIERFLATTGREFMAELSDASKLTAENGYGESMNKLRKTKAKVIESSGDSATVEIKRPDTPAIREDWIRVEGRWIPKELADGWSTQMADARSKLALMSDDDPESKQKALMQLAMIEGALDSLIAANTEAEFNAGIGAMMGMAMAAAMANGEGNGATISMAPTGQQPFMPMTMGNTQAPAPPSAGTPFPAPSPGSGKTIAGNDIKVSGDRIPPNEAHKYVNQVFGVTDRQGREMRGRLQSVDGDALVFERSVGGGTITFEYAKNEIASLHLIN